MIWTLWERWGDVRLLLALPLDLLGRCGLEALLHLVLDLLLETEAAVLPGLRGVPGPLL